MVIVKFGTLSSPRLEEYMFEEGHTVGDLLDAAEYDFDSSKEKITLKASGGTSNVDVGDSLVDGGIYMVTPNIKGA